jgi:hypothetical protein
MEEAGLYMRLPPFSLLSSFLFLVVERGGFVMISRSWTPYSTLVAAMCSCGQCDI